MRAAALSVAAMNALRVNVNGLSAPKHRRLYRIGKVKMPKEPLIKRKWSLVFRHYYLAGRRVGCLSKQHKSSLSMLLRAKAIRVEP